MNTRPALLRGSAAEPSTSREADAQKGDGVQTISGRAAKADFIDRKIPGEAAILSLFESGMDTLDIAKKLRMPEAAVLKLMTIQRSRQLCKPFGFADKKGRVRIYAMDQSQAAAFAATIGQVAATRPMKGDA